MSLLQNPCSVCGLAILSGDSFIGTGDGQMTNGGSFAHDVCYYRDQANHLQKLCEEQRSDNETLKNENELLICRFNDTFGSFSGMDEQLHYVIKTERERADKLEVRVRELDARVEEQKVTLKDNYFKVQQMQTRLEEQRAEIQRLMGDFSSLYAQQHKHLSQLAEKDKEIENCKRTSGELLSIASKYQERLKSELATQTERVQTLEKELEALRKKEGFN